MATVVKLRKDAKRKERVGNVPLPQASCCDPAVRQLLKAGEVVKLKDTWTDPKLIAEAESRLAVVEQAMLVKLPVHVWYGAFHLHHKVEIDGRIGFAVTCVCGQDHTLTTEQLIRALIEHTGCGRECCQQKVLLRLFWGSLADSLRLQWRLMQVCHPQAMPSYWGGLLDEVYERDLKHGFIRVWREALSKQVSLQNPEFRWITPINPTFPLSPDNLTLALTPWKGLTKLNRLEPVIAGQPIPIMEICNSLDVSLDRALDVLTDESVDPDTLFMALLQ